MLANDTLANVLHIDLSNKHYWIRSWPELFDKYLGGTGVAIQLLGRGMHRGLRPPQC